jgi:hypothetical protein
MTFMGLGCLGGRLHGMPGAGWVCSPWTMSKDTRHMNIAHTLIFVTILSKYKSHIAAARGRALAPLSLLVTRCTQQLLLHSSAIERHTSNCPSLLIATT